MTLWPYSVAPLYDPELSSDWQAVVHRGVGLVRQVREQLTAPVFAARLVYLTTPAKLDLIEQAINACRGPALSFDFFDPVAWRIHRGLAVGTGDGSTYAFAIPFGELYETDLTAVILVAGTAKTKGTDYEIGVANRLLWSEDFSKTATWAVLGGATVNRTSGQTDPVGGSTAWKIETTGGSSASKLYQAVGTPTAAQTQLTDMWVKNTGAKALTIRDDLGGSQVVAGGGSAWERVSFSHGGGVYSNIVFAAPAAGDSLTFYIWHPFCAWTDTNFGTPAQSWGYIPTVGAAIAADTKRRLKLVFYSGSIPTAGQAITIDAAGRRYYLCALSGAVSRIAVPKYRQLRLEVSVIEVAS